MATRLIEQLCLDSDPSTVDNWLERLENCIEIAILNLEDKLPENADEKAQKIANIKRSYLLSSIGPACYKLLKSYCTPDNPNQKTYDELKKTLQDNLAPRPTTVAEQYRFNLIKQESSESISLYMARVKETASTCGFGGFYDQMVRNRFICGLRNEKIRMTIKINLQFIIFTDTP